MTSRRSGPQSYEIHRDGVTLQVTRHPGAGPVIVVVPGVMADAASWAPVAEAVPGGYDVHVLNRRGRAPSGPLGPDYGLHVEIDDVRALLDAIPGSKHLFGWSYGGLAAIEAAVGRHDLASVIAYEPVSRPFAPAAIEPIRAALASGNTGRAVELINTDVSGYSLEHVAELRDSPAWDRLRPLALPLGDELAAIDAFSPDYDAYQRLTVPIALLIGEQNLGGTEPYSPAFQRFREALPQAAVTVLTGLGHLAHVEAPARLAQQIAAAAATSR